MNTSKWIELAAATCEDAGIGQDLIEIITTWEQTFEHNELFRNNAVFRLSEKRILKLYGTDANMHFNGRSLGLFHGNGGEFGVNRAGNDKVSVSRRCLWNA